MRQGNQAQPQARKNRERGKQTTGSPGKVTFFGILLGKCIL
jgi:hypothetical protein